MLSIDSITNSIFNSKTYFIHYTDSNDLYLIDCGDVEPIVDFTVKRNLSLKGIFFTHTHFDHIYGLKEVLSGFPECVVYTSEYGAEALFNDRKNLSLYHEQPINYKGHAPKILKEGCCIELFENCTLKVIETPGHCPSCLTYVVDDYIFTGDTYIPGLQVVTNLPKGDKAKAEMSLQKILKLSKGGKICSGHDMMEIV